MAEQGNGLAGLVSDGYREILDGWMKNQSAEGVKRTDLVPAAESERQSKDFLTAFTDALSHLRDGEALDIESPGCAETRRTIEAISDARIERGVSPVEMVWFILSIKPALVELIRRKDGNDDAAMVENMLEAERALDVLALHAMDVFLQKREEVIERQRSEMTEVSAPVVSLWDRIVTVPLIGTLDSFRAQTVMENLLSSIVEREAEVAIIDITGVSTVDTLVAQHLLKTAAAVRLMGAECVICGISPKIAQTVVHLGVDLPNVVTRIDLQSGLAYAFSKIGMKVVDGRDVE